MYVCIHDIYNTKMHSHYIAIIKPMVNKNLQKLSTIKHIFPNTCLQEFHDLF